VEKEYPIGELRLSLEIKKGWPGDSKNGSGIYPPFEARKEKNGRKIWQTENQKVE
jgi:hypothetical protein